MMSRPTKRGLFEQLKVCPFINKKATQSATVPTMLYQARKCDQLPRLKELNGMELHWLMMLN